MLIDRYLLRQFLWVWLVCFCSLTGLYFVIDALGNLEEFLSVAERSQRHFLMVMGEFYAFKAVAFFDRTSGIITLIAAMFTLAGLQRYNELTAILAAGVSKLRIAAPLLIAGTVISLGAAANRELFMPRHRDRFSRTPQELNNATTKSLQNTADIWSGILFQGKQLIYEQRAILQPHLQLPRSLAAPTRSWTATQAIYEPADEQHPAGYRLQGVTAPKDLAAVGNIRLERGEVVIHTPAETPWLGPQEAFVVSELAFDQLVDQAAWKQYSGTAELIAGLYNRGLNCGNDVRVTIHARILQPLLDLTLLVLGLPLVLKCLNRNVFVAVGQCVAVVLGFALVVLAAHFLGGSYLIAPVTGAWIPLLVFIPLAAYQGMPLWE